MSNPTTRSPGARIVRPGAALPLPEQDHSVPETKPKDRIERYSFTQPGGKVVAMEHNLETGETKIVGKED